MAMISVRASEARARLYSLLDSAERHEPMRITGRRKNAILISEERDAIQETLYLLSVPGMRESIRKGMKTPISRSAKEHGW